MVDSRIDELRRRLERDPGSRLFAQLAEEYRKAGALVEAIRVARAGLAVHPTYASARLTLGRALLESGDAGGARQELEAALREAPDNILASRFLGQALEALGELGPALVQLQRTLKMAPGDRQLESKIASIETRLREPALGGASRVTSRPPAEHRGPTPPTRPATEARRTEVPGGGWTPSAAEAPPSVPPPSGRPPLPRTLVPAPPPLPGGRSFGEGPGWVAPRAGAPPAWTTEDSEEGAAPARTVAEPVTPPQEDRAAPLRAGAVPVGEPVFDFDLEPPGEPTPPPPDTPTGPQLVPEGPLTSSTLGELYLKQGLVGRAVEVFRQVAAEDPTNEKVRSRLAEIEALEPGADARTAKRQAIERTIAGLEGLLAALKGA